MSEANINIDELKNNDQFGNSIGTFYANEPIVVSFTLAKPYSTTGISMVQGVIQLSKKSDFSEIDYEFSVGMEWGDTLHTDISSAFRAEIMRNDMTNPIGPDGNSFGGNPTKDKCVMYIAYGSRYLLNGVSTENIPSSTAYATAWRGGRSEGERAFGTQAGPQIYTEANCGSETQLIGYLIPQTTKPNSSQEWEIVNVGDVMRLGIFNGYASASNIEKEYTSGQFGHKIYVEDNPLRRNFMFENHLGFIESASCMMRESKSYKITSNDRFRTYAPSISVQSSLFSKKTGGRAVWKMSSGYVSRVWAEWFATEFLMSPKHWMAFDTGTIDDKNNKIFKWLPVSITPDSDSTTIYDASKGEITAINFTVTSGIKGITP